MTTLTYSFFLFMPSNVIVADGDGVIGVPRAASLKVAEGSRKTLKIDKAACRQLYQDLGILDTAAITNS